MCYKQYSVLKRLIQCKKRHKNYDLRYFIRVFIKYTLIHKNRLDIKGSYLSEQRKEKNSCKWCCFIPMWILIWIKIKLYFKNKFIMTSIF